MALQYGWHLAMAVAPGPGQTKAILGGRAIGHTSGRAGTGRDDDDACRPDSDSDSDSLLYHTLLLVTPVLM